MMATALLKTMAKDAIAPRHIGCLPASGHGMDSKIWLDTRALASPKNLYRGFKSRSRRLPSKAQLLINIGSFHEYSYADFINFSS
jgi:hypothetical protein